MRGVSTSRFVYFKEAKLFLAAPDFATVYDNIVNLFIV